MMFRSAAMLALWMVSTTNARKTTNNRKLEMPEKATISASSKAGQKLMSKARMLNDERDVTWVAKYDIKYTGCSSLIQVREEGGGDDGGMLYTQNLVKFSLCPSGNDCESCEGGGQYVVNMMEFVQTWTEYKEQEQEQICESIAENCYCDDANDEDYCLNQCYTSKGQSDCIEYDDGEEAFEVNEYIECAQMEDNGNNNNNNNNGNNYYNNEGGDNWYGDYFIGPYCSEEDGFSIFLGVFYDEGCSSRAATSAYASRNYGVELPYSSTPIIQQECVSCKQVDEDNDDNNNNNNNNNNNGNYYYEELEVNELCDGLYEEAARCEQNVDTDYKDSSGCDYISSILPNLDAASRNKKASRNGGGGAYPALAWVFAFTTLLFGSYASFLYKKLSRSRVSLSGSNGALA